VPDAPAREPEDIWLTTFKEPEGNFLQLLQLDGAM
jgi:hypothetical protein